MVGSKPAEVSGITRAWVQLIHREDSWRVRRSLIEASRSGTAAVVEYRLRHASGVLLRIRHDMQPLESQSDATAIRWIHTLENLNYPRAQAARHLQYDDRADLEQVAVAIVRTSLEGELRWVNRAFCDMIGYSRVEVLRLNIRDVTHPEDIPLSTELRAELMEGSERAYQRELRLRSKSGRYFWVNVATSLVREADRQTLHFVTVLIDISRRKRAEQEVSRFSAAMDATVDAIFLSDPTKMRVLYVNESACQRLGYTREQLLQKPTFELLGTTREQLERDREAIIAAGEGGLRTESRFVRHDGSKGWTELLRRAVATPDGTVIVTVARDVSEGRAQEEKIERLNRVYSMLSGINGLIVRVRDRAELLRESCRIAHEIGGFSAVSIRFVDTQQMIAEPVAWAGDEEMVRWLRKARFSIKEESGESLLAELMRTRRPAITNDAQHDLRVPFREALAGFGINSAVFLPLTVGDGVQGLLAMYSPREHQFDEAEIKLLSELAADISFAIEHVEQSERAAYLALYDELTGLANHRLLMERLEHLTRVASEAKGKLALALLDLERLRAVNKSLGRGAGDTLLRQVSERLTKSAGAGVIARSGSNHFALVLASVSDRSDAERMLNLHLHAGFAAPHMINGSEIKIGVKAGLVMFPNDGRDAETLLVNAESALRKAKQTGERHVFYTPDIGERTGVWLSLESKLGRALERGEFMLHYQPKVDTITRRIVALEALMRWQNPELGLVSPAKFIPLMEETGMILDVGAWALRQAALDQRKWSEQGFKTLRVAVNVSVVQLRQRQFVHTVEEAIGGAGIDLEMTESLVMEDVEANIRKLEAIRELGVQLAVDDFGTGYSSLAYLAKLPVQVLKIDRSFIASMLSDPAALTLVQTIISLAHALRLKVVAEGVEQEEQARYLGLLRCDQIQGYLVSKPIPFDEMTRLLRKRCLPR